MRIVRELYFRIYSSQTVRGFFGQNHTVSKPYGFLAPCLQTVKFFRSVSKLGGFRYSSTWKPHPVCIRCGYIWSDPRNIQTGWVLFSETVVYVPSLRTAWFRKPIIHSERIFTNWILSVFKFEDYAHDFVIFWTITTKMPNTAVAAPFPSTHKATKNKLSVSGISPPISRLY